MKKIFTPFLIVTLLAFSSVGLWSPKYVLAASITSFSDALSTLAPSVAADHTIFL